MVLALTQVLVVFALELIVAANEWDIKSWMTYKNITLRSANLKYLSASCEKPPQMSNRKRKKYFERKKKN